MGYMHLTRNKQLFALNLHVETTSWSMLTTLNITVIAVLTLNITILLANGYDIKILKTNQLIDEEREQQLLPVLISSG